MKHELQTYYGLSALPFTKEIATDDLLHLPSVEDSLNTLMLLVETRGIGVLTGKSGTGKSCLLRMLEAKLHTGLYKVLYLCHTSVGIHEFYTHLLAALGLESGHRRAAMFRAIKQRVFHLAKESRVQPVLLIDEAHLLGTDILRELRLLLNFEIDSYNALTIILCGQESLMQKFSLSILEPLANSITISVAVSGLPMEESFAYIENRVSACGGQPSLFTKNALTLIHQASTGVLRSINTIAHSALLKAYYANASTVEAEHVQAVLQR